MGPEALIPVATLMIGAGMSYLAEWGRRRRQRRDDAGDALRSTRATAYRQYVRVAHDAAHVIGRTAPGCPTPLNDPAEAWASVDRDVARDLYELEMFASDHTLEAARAVRRDLRTFREAVIAGATYMDADYHGALGAYQRSRQAFLTSARSELVG